MNLKLRNSLYFLSDNARITTKELAKKLRISQQSSSYLVNKLKTKKIIQQSTVIIDPARLNFTNVFVGFDYTHFNEEKQKEIIKNLSENPQIVAIYDAQNVDILVEFSAPNLSSFNKSYIEITDAFSRIIETKFIYPVIVKHLYNKTYLSRKKKSEIIIHGDRDPVKLTDNELRVLQELAHEPDATLTKISLNLKLSVRSVLEIKKKLEKQKIIRGYSIILNTKKLGITKYFILLKLTPGGLTEMNTLISEIGLQQNCISITKIIGEYQLMIGIETIKEINFINEIRKNFSVKEYKIIEIHQTRKKQGMCINEQHHLNKANTSSS